MLILSSLVNYTLRLLTKPFSLLLLFPLRPLRLCVLCEKNSRRTRAEGADERSETLHFSLSGTIRPRLTA